MRSLYRFYLVGGLLLISLLAACGSENTPTTQPVAAAPTIGPNQLPVAPTFTPVLKLPFTPTPAPAVTPGPRPPDPPTNNKPLPITPLRTEMQRETTAGPPPGTQPLCTFSADYVFPPFSDQLKQAQDIVQVQVGNIGPMIWNTADGKQPLDACRGPAEYYQYSPIELTIKGSYKGALAAGSKLTIWRGGAPGSLIEGNYDYFPKTGETLILFLGDNQNIRPETPKEPLNSRIVWELYRQPTPGVDKWVSQNTFTPFSIEYLKAVIKDPTIIPTPTPYIPQPTPTAYARAGQTFQPTKYYKLDTAKAAYVKKVFNNPGLTGSIKPDDPHFDQLVKAFDQPLKVLENLPNGADYTEETYVPFGFELGDNDYVSFVYDPTTNTLTHQLRDDHNLIRLAAPPELKTILGL